MIPYNAEKVKSFFVIGLYAVLMMTGFLYKVL
nr:MAG TPA: hypothetical protein [Caudoviricetes sp.]